MPDLDKERYRYQEFMSDIAGQDIHKHDGLPERAIIEIRDWLCAASRRPKLPGGAAIVEHYRQFRADLPTLCDELQRQESSLWLQTSR